MANRRDEEVFLKGKIKWCKHLKPDTRFEPKWSVVMYVEGEELEKVREWQAQGIKNKVSKDDDGWFITLSRKTEIKTKQGRAIGMEPPKVIDKEGSPIVTMVGNGSDGIAKCTLWTFNPQPGISGKALRWEGLRVDNLIPFDSDRDYPDGGESIRTLKNEPEQLF